MEFTITEIVRSPTLCLNMIVRNESKIIIRLLESVITNIDCYCICDTGSTDNTVALIKKYFEEKGMSGKIVNEPFVNFAHNRNFALQSCIGMSDYVLLLDADMVLEIPPSFNKSTLQSADSFNILQGTDDFYYNNMRIIRNNGLYTYIGVTHEYISTPSNNTTINFDKNQIFIRDIGDGGSKSNKTDRDIKLLTKGIEQNPNNDRYHFYLANTYHDSGKYVEAIDIYRKRIKLGGWCQEIWYSYYRIGLCYKHLNKMEDAIFAWLEAYDLIPNRIENLYEIVQYYRIVGKCKLGYAFYKMAKSALQNVTDKNSYLFLSNDVYTYKLEYELSILSCYNNIKNINDQVITVLNNSNEQNIINNVLSNMKFYKDILTPIITIDFTSKIKYQTSGEKDKIRDKIREYNSSSACIIPYNKDGGYLMNIRLVNYTIDSNGNYLNCDDHIITINKCIEFTKEFKIMNETIINSEFDGKRYIGVEDIRIFKDEKRQQIIFMGTALHQNGNIGINTGVYDKDMNVTESEEVKPSFTNSNCEKNWVFCNIENAVNIVYQWYPLKICKLNKSLTNYSLDLIRENNNMPKIFKHVRGSTNGSNFNNEIWFLTHIVSYEQPRHYYHIFAVFDNALNKLLRYSAPFKFEGECIEYSIGLIVENDRVIIPYSTCDRTTKLAIYNKTYIDTILKYNHE